MRQNGQEARKCKMEFWLILILANLAVGVCVGMTGVAGFLLPIVYTGPLLMGTTEALALSFGAFISAGVLAALNYGRQGNLDLPFGVKLSIGSLAGAVLGVRLNMVIPEEQVKMILYLVVLVSGISILLRREGNSRKTEETKKEYQIREHLGATLLLGFVTGALCAMSGAGGPVLVMPLLVVLGIPVRAAVGVSLFNMIFISIPAFLGYLFQCFTGSLVPMLAAALFFHGLGVWAGSRWASRINQVLLKRGIAVFSVVIALWRLFF